MMLSPAARRSRSRVLLQAHLPQQFLEARLITQGVERRVGFDGDYVGRARRVVVFERRQRPVAVAQGQVGVRQIVVGNIAAPLRSLTKLIQNLLRVRASS